MYPNVFDLTYEGEVKYEFAVADEGEVADSQELSILENSDNYDGYTE